MASDKPIAATPEYRALGEAPPDAWAVACDETDRVVVVAAAGPGAAMTAGAAVLEVEPDRVSALPLAVARTRRWWAERLEADDG